MLTIDFIQSIVAKMIPEVQVKSAQDLGGGNYRIFVCKTYWIKVNETIVIDGNNYVITSFVKDTSIDLTGGTLPEGSFNLTAPFYYHGTPIASNNEWIVQRREADKYPLVYLVEPFNEDFQDELNAIDRVSSLKILFLDSTLLKKETADNYTDVISPLKEQVEYFVYLLQNEGLVQTFTHAQKVHVKIGVETTDKGHTSNIFNDPLNGIEVNLGALEIMKSNNCLNC